MINEELIEGLKLLAHTMKRDGDPYFQRIAEDAIKALEQPRNNLAITSQDCISREEAINEMSNALKRVFVEHRDIAEKAMNKLPSVTPQPKIGQWIDGKCNKCGTHAPYWAMASTYYCSEYCPNCGADMRGDKMTNKDIPIEYFESGGC